MSQQKIKVYVTVDEHGNYHAIGSSLISNLNENTAIAIIEEGIKKEGVETKTTSFNVMIDLPEKTHE